MFRDQIYYDKINFNELHFNYFITQGDGSIICAATDEEGNDITCSIAANGSVKHRRNQGIWKQFSIPDAASLRYVAGRFLHRDVPTYHTNRIALR